MKKLICSNCKSQVHPIHRCCDTCGCALLLDTCPKCGETYNRSKIKCPKCGHSTKIFNAVWLTIVFIIIFIFASNENLKLQINLFLKKQTTFVNTMFNTNISTNNIKIKSNTNEIIDIPIKPLIKLSGKSRNEILKIRKDAVTDSVLFSNIKYYEPNPNVYLVEDGLPWIGAYQVSCIGAKNNPNIGEGTSRESLGILNPELMFYFTIPSYNDNPAMCSEADYLIPKKITYTKESNTITAYFDYKTLFERRGYFYTMYPEGTNARDFGYNWVFANNTRNITFKDKNNNMGITPTKILGYYHKGYSCGLKSGCNNFSPSNPPKFFKLNKLPAHVNLKLWKNKPITTLQKADLNYIMVFE